MEKVSGKVLVMGGTGALGSAICSHLRRRNFEVAASFFRDVERAQSLKNRLGCAVFQSDATDENAVAALFENCAPRFVIHCVGATFDAVLPRASPQNFAHTLETNAFSAFLATREGLRVLPDGGQILLVSSRVARVGTVGQSAYGAAKGAVLGLAKCAAIEGAPRKIAVNALLPGFAPSELSGALSQAVLTRRARENWISDADAGHSLAAFCAFLLDCKTPPTGQIFAPDCRL